MISNVFTPRSYELGKTVHERWNVGVFGPGLAYAPDERGMAISRSRSQLNFIVSMHGDQNADMDGLYTDDTGALEGTTQLVRDGQVIKEYAGPGAVFATLPPKEATYTTRTTATTSGPLSTRIDAEWTFLSGHVDGEAPKPIPVLVARCAPNLDDHNAAPAGKKFRFPVYVQRNGVEQPGQVNTPAVEISYDDGQTWQKVSLSSQKGKWLAEVNHPADAQFASLRWSVSDNEGNAAKATVIHAYALKK